MVTKCRGCIDTAMLVYCLIGGSMHGDLRGCAHNYTRSLSSWRGSMQLVHQLHWRQKVEKSGGLAGEKCKLIIHDLLFCYLGNVFSRWRARGNELSKAEQGASKAIS